MNKNESEVKTLSIEKETEKELLRSCLKEYVESITDLDRRGGYDRYKCPLCGSGGVGRGPGAFSVYEDGKKWKCFSCGEGGDIFTLIGLVEGLPEFKDQIRFAGELFGISGARADFADDPEPEKKPETTETTKTGKYKEFIDACAADVEKTEYFKERGLSDETIKRYRLGYNYKEACVVIPYDNDGSYYITRSVNTKKYRKPKSDGSGEAEEPVYNRDALYKDLPCFVCESPIDALSIIEAGGGRCSAIALGGTGSTKLIKQIASKLPKFGLILSFDQDDPGRKGEDKLAGELEKLGGVNFIRAAWSIDSYPEDKRKDTNDFLVTNKKQLSDDIRANVEALRKKIIADYEEQQEKLYAMSAKGRLPAFRESITRTDPVPTMFEAFDKVLDGGLYPGLYILGAISSLGKTTFMLQIADQIAGSGRSVLFVSLEMSANELIAKSISRTSYRICKGHYGLAKTARDITSYKRYEKYTDDEKKSITEATELYSNTIAPNIYYYEGVGDISVKEIREAVELFTRTAGEVPVVFVDYLQILAPLDDRVKTDKMRIDETVLGLRLLSRDFNCPVFTVSSINRDSYFAPISMSSFKESGAIEYGSDVLIGLQPQGMLPGNTKDIKKHNAQLYGQCRRDTIRSIEAVILKNRNGGTGGRVGFDFWALYNDFEPDINFDAAAAVARSEFSEVGEDV